MKKPEYTGCRDSEQQKIYYGDNVRGSYGIPPIGIVAKVVKYKGEPIIRTPEHTPKWGGLRIAVECLQLRRVGE